MEINIMVLKTYYLNVTSKICSSYTCGKNQNLKELRGIKVAPEILPLHSLKP